MGSGGLHSAHELPLTCTYLEEAVEGYDCK